MCPRRLFYWEAIRPIRLLAQSAYCSSHLILKSFDASLRNQLRALQETASKLSVQDEKSSDLTDVVRNIEDAIRSSDTHVCPIGRRSFRNVDEALAEVRSRLIALRNKVQESNLPASDREAKLLRESEALRATIAAKQSAIDSMLMLSK